MKNNLVKKRILCILVLALLIITIIPVSTQANINSVDTKIEDKKGSEWKFLSRCFIRGEHNGNVWPQHRIGFAFTLTVDDGYSDDIELVKGNENIPITKLQGYGFFGYIEYYTPRYPATIFGYLIRCKYVEKVTLE